jgi:hypothetical protein
MSPTHQIAQHIDRDQLVLYALQFLCNDENSAARDHLSDCRECRRELDRITGDLAVVALTADLHSPPALARQRVAKLAARERKLAVAQLPDDTLQSYSSLLDPDARRARKSSSALPLILSWVLAAAFLAVSVYLYQQHLAMQMQVNQERIEKNQAIADAARATLVYDMLTDPTVMKLTLTKSVAGSWPTGRVSYQPDTGSLLFVGVNLDPLPPHQTYQLWLLPSDARPPIPAGTFTPDSRGNANVVLPDIPHDVNARSFAISLEDQGGSTTPTLPYVLTGSQ